MSDGQNQEISPATAQVGPLPATDFPTIYRLLVKLDYRQQDEIQDLERQLYLLLKENPENINGLIILMQEQIMRGEHQKAKSLAYKIWDLGGEMSPALEALFISNLINLGLTDMAGILLKPKFDALNTYIKIFYPQLLKYAIATGNLNYIERIAVLDSNFETKKALQNFVNMFKYMDAADHFKALQQSLLAIIKDVLLSYDHQIYTDRGFTDVVITVYTGEEAGDLPALNNKLEMQITAYCAAKGLPRFNNLSYAVRPIKEHPSLLSMSTPA